MVDDEHIALKVRGLSKLFAGQRALDDVHLTIRRGEIHALLGANGSGKSTLIKVLAGYHQPEAGAEVLIAGQALTFGSPPASHAAGLRFIHQDLGLIDALDVTDNLALGTGRAGLGWISDRQSHDQAQAVLEKYGMDLDPRAKVRTLKASEKSMLAIIRAVEDGLVSGGLLVLDEPTAALPPNEVRVLIRLLLELRDRGVSLLYVTHRLPEVFEIADRVTVLRDGRPVASRAIEDLTSDSLVELILGQPLTVLPAVAVSTAAEVVLDVRNLRGGTVAHFELQACAGEIVGITGLIGSGYEAVLGLIFGAQTPRQGTISVAGEHLDRPGPKTSIRAGLAFAPADRRRLGAVLSWPVEENLTLPALRPGRHTRWLSQRAERADTRRWLERLQVKPADPTAVFMSLSGGNQQKIVIARWLRSEAKVLLLDEPTIGVDAGAKVSIYRELRAAAAAGATVIISSSDTEELAEVCDRVLVMGGGVIATALIGPLHPDELFAEALKASAALSPRTHAA